MIVCVTSTDQQVPSEQELWLSDVDYIIGRDINRNFAPSLELDKNPYTWTCKQVTDWIKSVLHRYQFDYSSDDICNRFYGMDGLSLCSLKKEQFVTKSPENGLYLEAELEWIKNDYEINSMASDNLNNDLTYCNGLLNYENENSISCVFGEPLPSIPISRLGGDDSSEWYPGTSDDSSSGSMSPYCQFHDINGNDIQDISDTDSVPVTPATVVHKIKSKHSPKNTIHLWQFLRELLKQSDSYNGCIRWLDRDSGIFKIEDSVRVARLWGQRKNRPAMNYDKLSRSIRQYYKKGIIKKTTSSKRLVYQFCKDIE